MTMDFKGTPEQIATIRAMADALTQTLGDKIKDVHVVFKSDEDMRKRQDDGQAYGFWSARNRELSLWDALDEYQVEKTFAHEVMHVVDSDWLTPAQRDAIVEMMEPKPKDWRDKVVNGEKVKYWSLPSEVFAVYASAAVGNFDKPPYRQQFKRSIAEARKEELRKITMREGDIGDRGSNDVENPVVLPDTVEELQEQLEAAQKRLNTAKAALLPLQNELTDTKKALDGARSEAKAARDQLAPVQTRLDEAKSQLTTTQTQLADAKAQLAPVQAQLATAQADLATAQAERTAAQAQAAQATSQLAAAVAAKDAAEQGRAQAGMQLAQAKAKVSEIRTALAAGDTASATAKAIEIAAL